VIRPQCRAPGISASAEERTPSNSFIISSVASLHRAPPGHPKLELSAGKFSEDVGRKTIFWKSGIFSTGGVSHTAVTKLSQTMECKALKRKRILYQLRCPSQTPLSKPLFDRRHVHRRWQGGGPGDVRFSNVGIGCSLVRGAIRGPRNRRPREARASFPKETGTPAFFAAASELIES